MKWEYKVVNVNNLFHQSDNHDIAVSKEAAESRRAKIGVGLESELNRLGAQSWELVSLMGEFGVFKKPK